MPDKLVQLLHGGYRVNAGRVGVDLKQPVLTAVFDEIGEHLLVLLGDEVEIVFVLD